MVASNFSIVFASLNFAYPELFRFGPTIPLLYTNIVKSYPFEALRHNQDQAELQQEAQRLVRLTPYSAILEESVSGDFRTTILALSGITNEIQMHFKIPVFWNPRIVLRARLPVSDQGDGAVAFLRTRITSINTDQINTLGGSVSGLALTVETADGQIGEERRISVELGPYWQDRSQIQIEMSLYELRPIEPSAIQQFIIDAHGYFIREVASFVESVIS